MGRFLGAFSGAFLGGFPGRLGTRQCVYLRRQRELHHCVLARHTLWHGVDAALVLLWAALMRMLYSLLLGTAGVQH